MKEIDDTADIIQAGGRDALQAARAIADALPLAMTREVARNLDGSVEWIGSYPSVRAEIDGVVLNFVLFGHLAPWAGITDAAKSEQLNGNISWGAPERLWPKWAYLKRAGEQGPALIQAATSGDADAVAALIPTVARTLIGP
jgi:hypothetical protein